MCIRDRFRTVFLPFLNDIGLMWQTSVITVAHEHFLSNLLRQKILYQIDQLHAITADPDQKVFVLFLPDCEVHEIGLLYAQYESVSYTHLHLTICDLTKKPSEILNVGCKEIPSITAIIIAVEPV